MWLLELMGLVVVSGVVLGVVWRAGENWYEQREFKASLLKGLEEQQATTKNE